MEPVVSLTYRSIFPPNPTATQLKYSPPHLYKYDSWLRILGSDKGSPGLCPPPPPAASRRLRYTTLYLTPTCIASKTLVTQRNSPQTAPPDCSQTRLKSDHKTTPQTDPVYLPPHHHIIVWRNCIYSNIFEYFLIQIVILFYLFRIFDAITSIALKLLWVSDTCFFEFTVSTFYKET